MKKAFAVRLPDTQLEKLKEIAKREDRSVGAVIRIMIKKCLEERDGNKNK